MMGGLLGVGEVRRIREAREHRSVTTTVAETPKTSPPGHVDLPGITSVQGSYQVALRRPYEVLTLRHDVLSLIENPDPAPMPVPTTLLVQRNWSQHKRSRVFPLQGDPVLTELAKGPATLLELGGSLPHVPHDHLDGMYAIAILDLRTEPTLVLATDHAGMKPLYHHVDEAAGSFAFASEIQPLLSLPGTPHDLWAPGLDAYLTTKAVFGDRTLFEGIRVLPPATTLTFSRRGGLRIHARPSPAVAGDHGLDDVTEAGAAVLDVLRTEVRRLAVADVPVCGLVSGGLDSSLVAALLAETTDELHSFTLAYRGDWPFDERPYATALAEHVGTVHHTVEADPAEFPDLLREVVLRLGQPNADPIGVSTYALFRGVREAGFPVALTGDGADEVFLGYGRTHTALTADGPWQQSYLDALAAVPRHARHALYTDEYRNLLRTRPAPRMPPGDRLASITALEVDERMPAYHLRRVDHLSMAHGVESRLPFCQRSVQELALSLPQESRLVEGEVKRALRVAGRGLVPDVVLDRPKQPFTLPINAMLRPGQPLMTYAQDVLSPAAVARDGQLSPRAVTGLLRKQAETPTDSIALAVWALLVHQVWRDLLVDGFGRSELAA